MMSVLNTGLDKANEIPGLRAVRVHFDTAQGADTFGSDGNRLMIIGFYDDKQTAEAARERVKADFSTLSEFVVGEPIVREGEIIWSFDADGAPNGPWWARRGARSHGLRNGPRAASVGALNQGASTGALNLGVAG